MRFFCYFLEFFPLSQSIPGIENQPLRSPKGVKFKNFRYYNQFCRFERANSKKKLQIETCSNAKNRYFHRKLSSEFPIFSTIRSPIILFSHILAVDGLVFSLHDTNTFRSICDAVVIPSRSVMIWPVGSY